MTERTVRAFLGFDLPDEVRRTAAGLRTLVEDRRQAVRWVKGANIHLTLRFLGATPEQAVTEIAAALESELTKFPALAVQVAATGVFPAASRPSILWLGVAGQTRELQELEEIIHGVVGPMGFPREEREFSPHITIGRVRYPQKITPDVTNFLNAEYTPVECPLQTLNLYESRNVGGGVAYTPLAAMRLQSSDEEEK
ncbi:MAG: RNA 2',3'-cyclic phosphodiesterase [Candidatus Neomarinimicrobiota bacterium]